MYNNRHIFIRPHILTRWDTIGCLLHMPYSISTALLYTVMIHNINSKNIIFLIAKNNSGITRCRRTHPFVDLRVSCTGAYTLSEQMVAKAFRPNVNEVIRRLLCHQHEQQTKPYACFSSVPFGVVPATKRTLTKANECERRVANAFRPNVNEVIRCLLSRPRTTYNEAYASVRFRSVLFCLPSEP